MCFPVNWHLTADGHEGERGQTLVEYGLVVSIVSIALIGTLIILKGSVVNLYQQIIDVIEALV